ncbi:CAMK family protein kinase [Trichomonas vaginalis G3]|uniref:CAMK family protein kinase n=1 Tax=Trichomonas vaginalis (strain ATCC PRA-98 / G3) TaxID=412133 RepID=A2F755_TRIV3|nr:protein serine/threonine kinase protein [Trichomonas vaginalis G3]EAX99292.1 CAMK family protein kinase [Trichomonas vaginalis G3]KAI5524958.1 protein serine/threonine kinase protein [Trichomonas vaginalis G3]|eukprot:XP_001312222.1 CAMK family protein kinase [Trichomonas vaginalis G3]
MGLCYSTPLQKVRARPNGNGNRRANDMHQLSTYTSITSFIIQNDNPVMYDWAFKKEIGTGSMSHVFLVENVQSGEKCAAKVYSMSLLRRKSIGVDEIPLVGVQKEIDIMYEIAHRYVLKIVDVFEDDPTQSLLIITQFAQKGSLQSLLDVHTVTPTMCETCFYQIAEALRYIHSLNIVHRDIKPENILVFSESLFVISDFSVSSKLSSSNERLNDTKGSPAFLSPEECGGGDFAPKPADVWAYGVSLYMSLFGILPFNIGNAPSNNITSAMMFVKQCLDKEELTFPENASPLAISLLTKVLAKKPEDRPTFETITKDPFFDRPRELDEKIQREKNDLSRNDTSDSSFTIQ